MELDNPGASVLNSWRAFPAMYPLPTNSGCDMADLAFLENQNLLPTNLPSDPRKWCHPQVCSWLEWCIQQFSLPPIDLENFHMNGKALCLLTKSDFKDRVPRVGDVLYNTLHILLHKSVPNVAPNVSNILLGQAAAAANDKGAASISRYWPRSVSSDFHSIGYVLQDNTCNISNASASPQSVGGGSGGDVDSTVILSPAPSTEGHPVEPKERSQISSENQNGIHSEEEEEVNMQKEFLPIVQGHQKSFLNVSNNSPSEVPQEKSVRLLWDFLQQLLNDAGQKYKSCIAWKDKSKGIFKIVDPHQLAYLWGMQKNHLNMNFDKMSRALRYYYRVKILQKEQGERHCYKFLRHPNELRNCKQRSLLGKLNNNSTASNKNNNSSIGETALDMSIKDEWTGD